MNNSKSPVNTYLEEILADLTEELDKTNWTITEEEIKKVKLVYAMADRNNDRFDILFSHEGDTDKVSTDGKDGYKISIPTNTKSPILIEQGRLAIIGWATTLVEQFNARVDRGMVELEIGVLETRLAQEHRKLEVANEKLEEYTNPTNLVEKAIDTLIQNLEKGNPHG